MPLTITQEDREAAANVEALLNYVTVPHEWEMLLEAFARHRIQALEAAAKVAEERKTEWHNAIANGLTRLSCNKSYATGSAIEAEVIAAAIRTLYGAEPYKDGEA